MHGDPQIPAVTISPTGATSQIEITLKYDGIDVDDGTMPIEDVISALRGFSNAYGTVASSKDPTGQHQIRVAAINRSSFAVSILAWASENKGLVTASGSIAAAIVAFIRALIDLKKQTHECPVKHFAKTSKSSAFHSIVGIQPKNDLN